MIRISLDRYGRLVPEIIRERGLIFLVKYLINGQIDAVLRKAYQAYSLAYASLFHVPLIHVIGDSHSWAFKKQRFFIVKNIGPATAYNLVNENSTIQSNKKLFRAIEDIDPRKDYVILSFGEIDCRVHFYNQYMKNNGTIPMDRLMDMTIGNYGKVLCQLRDRGIKVVVYGVLPAARDVVRFPAYSTRRVRKEIVDCYKNTYPYQAPPEMRSRINCRFNEKLKAYCEAEGFKYLDIYSVVADERGFVKDEFVADEIHVNGKIMPYVKVMLEKECDIRT